MYQDHKDLLSAFHAHGVRYLIVGGYAVIFHSQPRYTKDLDAPLDNITPQDFTDHGSFFRFGHDPQGIDILPGIPGVDFDAAWPRRVESVIDAETRLTAYFISRDDLIAAKLPSGRMRDLGDVEDMRAAVRSAEPDSPPGDDIGRTA